MRTDRQAMFHRIEMDVIEVPTEIVRVSNCVIIEPTLPNAATAVVNTRAGARCLAAIVFEPGSREMRFDERPARGKVAIAVRESDQRVQMIEQQNDGKQIEGARRSARGDRVVEESSGERSCKNRNAVFGDQGKEECTAGDFRSPIVGHALEGKY